MLGVLLFWTGAGAGDERARRTRSAKRGKIADFMLANTIYKKAIKWDCCLNVALRIIAVKEYKLAILWQRGISKFTAQSTPSRPRLWTRSLTSRWARNTAFQID